MQEPRRTLFVSIASYRDEQLRETIVSLLENASGEHEVRFGVCMQDTPEALDAFGYKDHPAIRLRYVPFTESLGVGWARHLIQQELFAGEDYFLQIDSHSRSCAGWDRILISQLNDCESPKPILSTYPNAFRRDDISRKYLEQNTCAKLRVRNFRRGQKIQPIGSDVVSGDKPVPGFWLGAGFLFTYGTWTKEVVYNKEIYFTGEEDYISVQSYLKGWDVYIPTRSTIWHDYTDNRSSSKEKYRVLHWEDHQGKNLHNQKIIENLYADTGVYASNRSIKTFCDLVQELSGNKGNESSRFMVNFDWSVIPVHDLERPVSVIVFAFFSANGEEIFRPDIYDKGVISRARNTLHFETGGEILDRIRHCVWWVRYADGTFGPRLEYLTMREGSTLHLAPR
jgi:hypothetical protein